MIAHLYDVDVCRPHGGLCQEGAPGRDNEALGRSAHDLDTVHHPRLEPLRAVAATRSGRIITGLITAHAAHSPHVCVSLAQAQPSRGHNVTPARATLAFHNQSCLPHLHHESADELLCPHEAYEEAHHVQHRRTAQHALQLPTPQPESRYEARDKPPPCRMTTPWI